MSVVAAALYVELLALITIHIIIFCNGNSYLTCNDSERQALEKFKQDLIDPSNRLASWIGDGDCCAWAGVVCNNLTGHVLELHLRNPASDTADYETRERLSLGGKINPSLHLLKHLNYLDLSNNKFEGIQIPPFFGSMKNLKYLNLGQNKFEGIIPHQLGNLSNLHYLDLSQNPFLYVDNLLWLSGFPLLEHLDLSFLNLSEATDSLLVLNALPSLKALLLTGCALSQLPPLSIVNFSSLAILDLSFNQFDSSLLSSWVFGLSGLVYLSLDDNNFRGPIPIGLENLTSLRVLGLSENNFSSSIPNWLYKFSHLESLDLGKNSLQGMLSDTLANMTSIKHLDLSDNRFEGVIPRSLGRLCNLRSIYVSGLKLSQQLSKLLNIFSSQCASNVLEILDFSNNKLSGSLTNQFLRFKHLDSVYLNDNFLSGPVPLFLGQLSPLRILDLSNNRLNGTLSQLHFSNLSRLLLFYTSGNSLKLEVNPDWLPPFQLEDLDLRCCHLGPKFPSWIKSQKHLKNLDLSYSGISDVIPSWFWKYFSQFHHLNLYHNQIHGKIPNLIKATQLWSLDLSWNNFSGPLPLISTSLNVLDLSNNGFSGSLHHFLGCGTNDQKLLQFLKVGGNFLSGQLPDCWMNWSFLIVLDLSNNKFIGSLPNSMGTLHSLQSIHLRKNNFCGSIPLSLQKCVELVLFDVAENKFSGNVPKWIGERYSKLRILILRSNKFHGRLPMELCRLTSLQILDLSSNNLFGTIPRCINNFTAMVTVNHSECNFIQYPSSLNFTGKFLNITELFVENELLVMRGKTDEYNRILNLVRSINLSDNKFSGAIPMEVTELGALQSLNFSYNLLTGKIPEQIGAMRSLEYVDLRRNQLAGEIPQSFSSLTFLDQLNLSYNNLIGKIPLSTQLQSFDASSYTGNALCGLPLVQNCTQGTVAKTEPDENENENENEVNWFYVSEALGFVVGFWGFIGTLLVNRRWRQMYYCFLDLLGDQFVVL